MLDYRDSYNVISQYFLLTAILTILTCHGYVLDLKSDPYGFYRKVDNCPKEWQRVGDSCIFVNNDDMFTWKEARQECQLKSGDLLVINSAKKQDWLLKESVMAETDGWWIGLFYNKRWSWVNAMNVNETVTPWSHEPTTGKIGDEEDCGAIYSNGNFTDKKCQLKYGYICKYTMPSINDVCPTDFGWKQIDNNCYYVSDVFLKTERLSWSYARSKCRSLVPKMKSDLLSISSMDEMTSLKLIAMGGLNGAIPWWTGLNDKDLEGNFVWADNTPADMNIITWDAAPNPDRKQMRNCAVMHTGGFIRDQNCEGKAFYICEMPTVREYVDLGCGSSKWIRANHYCYYFAKMQSSTWSEARDTCRRWDSQLMDVNSWDEKYWIEWQSYQMGQSGWWTGLHKNDGSSTWKWVNGNAADMSLIRWNQEPDNHNEDDDCTQITNDGTFIDVTCVMKSAYICQFPISQEMTCPNKAKKWVKHKNYCYYFSSGLDKKDLKTWFEVPLRCSELYPSVENELVTRLTIHSEEEKEWLEGYLASLSNTSATWWTGLNDRNVEGVWKWADDSQTPPDMSLIKWNGQPDNKNGNENCAAIFYEGRYADLNCNTPASFICKKSLTGGANKIQTNTFSFLFLVTAFSTLLLK